MTTPTAAEPGTPDTGAPVAPAPDALPLRPSLSIATPPAETSSAAAAAPAASAIAPTAPAVPPTATASVAPRAASAPIPQAGLVANASAATADGTPSIAGIRANPLLPVTITLGGLALASSIAWLIERRKRLREEDSVMWADVQPTGTSSIVTKVRLSEILPDSPDPAEAARAVYITAIGETISRREATLIDLHQLQRKITRRCDRGDIASAVLALQQHLLDFRYTSPWVFLELRELYRVLDRQKEWEVTREAFRARFGQNAPSWTGSVGADLELAADTQIIESIQQQWPQRTVRLWILRWMLGEPDMRKRCMGPPLLPLGVYRDMMLLDTLLDEVMITAAA